MDPVKATLNFSGIFRGKATYFSYADGDLKGDPVIIEAIRVRVAANEKHGLVLKEAGYVWPEPLKDPRGLSYLVAELFQGPFTVTGDMKAVEFDFADGNLY